METNTRLEILLLLERGCTEQQIVKELGTSSGRIWRVKKAYKERGTVKPLPRGGSVSMLTDEIENSLCLFVEGNRQCTVSQVQEHLNFEFEEEFGKTTAWKWMKELGFSLKERSTCPFFTNAHVAQRLQYCLRNKGMVLFFSFEKNLV